MSRFNKMKNITSGKLLVGPPEKRSGSNPVNGGSGKGGDGQQKKFLHNNRVYKMIGQRISGSNQNFLQKNSTIFEIFFGFLMDF